MGKSTVPKNVQIPFTTMIDLWGIFCCGPDGGIDWDLLDLDFSEMNRNRIREIQGVLNSKMESTMRRMDYAAWHDVSRSPEEREKWRQEYLDAAGIHPDWRW